MKRPVLWQFTSSHYNEKARWALDFKGIAYERHSLLPGRHEAVIKKMTGQTAVPVLVLDGTPIHDTTRIIEALERTYPEPPLYPLDAAARRRALDLEDFFDEELGPHIRRVAFHLLLPYPRFVAGFFGQDASKAQRLVMRAMLPLVRGRMEKDMKLDDANVEISRQKTLAALDRVEKEVGPSGHLVGEQFTVADLTAAALFSPLVAPPEFPYRPLEPWPRQVVELRESLAHRRGFLWVLETYRRHRGRSLAVAA